MQLTRDEKPNANLITGLGDDGVRVRDRVYAGSIVVARDALVETWPVTGAEQLAPQHWQDVLALQPEIVLLGTGRALSFPPGQALAPLYARGIGVEVMDTPAACRTFNLLLTEGRSVVAALIVGDVAAD